MAALSLACSGNYVLKCYLMFVFKLNSLTFLGHYLDFVIEPCYCNTNSATCGTKGVYI